MEIISKGYLSLLYRDNFYKKLKTLNITKHLKPILIIFIHVFSVGIYLNLDSTMIGYLKDLKEVGLYTSAIKMTKILIPIIMILSTVISPQIIGAIKNEDKKEVYKYMNLFIDFNFFISLPIIFLFLILTNEIISVFSGDGYYDSVITMKIMTPIILMSCLGTFFGGQILIPNNKEKIVLKVSLGGLISNLILNFLLIPKFGRNGAAIATVLTETFVFLCRLYCIKKIYYDYVFLTLTRKKYIYSIIIPCIISSIANKYIVGNDFFKIIIISIIFGIIYIFILFFMKERFIVNIFLKLRGKKSTTNLL